MSNESPNEAELSEIELLLPWYATGRLEPADTARVEAFLKAHPDMRRRIELIREEQAQSTRANEDLGYPSAASLDRMMATVGAQARYSSRAEGLRGWLADFFAAPSPQGVRWAAAAAGLLLLLQAAVIGALIAGRGAETYQTAGREDAADSAATLIVGFSDAATASAISGLLADVGAQIVDGPKPGNLYRIRLTKQGATATEREAAARKLRERADIVKVVLAGKE